MKNASNINILENLENLEDLKNAAIAIKNDILLESPLVPTDYVTEVPTSESGIYCQNNGVLAFISGRVYYVIPSTKKVVAILRSNGFAQKFFWVVCSNCDQPAEPALREKWTQLRAMEREVRQMEFEKECEAYCDEHHIGSISQALLDKYCMEMPAKGISVKYVFQERPSRHYPAIMNSFLDCIATPKLGKYCCNNGTLVFVYRNGKTYVTRACWLIDILSSVGYKYGGLFVPFSNSETILDEEYHQKWEEIKVVCAE